MLTNVETMFDNMTDMMKKLKKKAFEANSAQFVEKNGHYIEEMTTYIEQASDKDEAAAEVAKVLGESVENRFATGAKKKIPSRTQADINFFMIYYVFPSILRTNHEEAKRICDAICSEWKQRFKNSEIGYTDYDTLYSSFREKIFGIF